MDISSFISYLLARGFSQNTAKAYESDLVRFEQFLKAKRIRCTSVTARLLQEHIAQLAAPDEQGQRLAQSTVWRHVASISTYYDWLRMLHNGKLHNPAKIIARPRMRRGQPKPIGEPQIAALLEQVTNIRDKALISLFITSGLRLSEVFQLNRNSIKVEQKLTENGETRTLASGTVRGKGDKEREFLTDRATVSLLIQYLSTRRDQCPALFISNRNQRLSRREIQHIFSKWCRRLSLPNYHIHQCRHAFADRLANAGMPSITLKELMGHESFNTTQGYFRIRRQRIATEYFAAMELINPQP